MTTSLRTLLLASVSMAGALSFSSASAVELKDAQLYKDVVAPVIASKCVSCHGADKQKRKLRMDSLEAILKGGGDGAAIKAGDAKGSLAMERVHLPGDDDEHMPPSDEPQLTKEEIALLELWIQTGAKADLKVVDAKPAEGLIKTIEELLKNPPKAALASASAPKEDPKQIEAKIKAAAPVIAAVEKAGASLMQIAQDTSDLRFSALNVAADFKDDGLVALKPLADQIKWVDLARTKITDAGLANVGGLKSVTRLHLENTAITDAGLDQLKNLAQLEYLNLYGTKVTDAGVMKLAGLKNLKKIFLWQTQVTEAGAKKLEAALPGLVVNIGWKEAPVVAVAPAPAPAKPAPPTPPTKPVPAPPAKPVPAPPAKPVPAPAPPAKPAAPVAAKLDPAKVLVDAQKAANDAKAAADVAQKAATNAANAAKQAQSLVDELKKASTPPEPKK